MKLGDPEKMERCYSSEQERYFGLVGAHWGAWKAPGPGGILCEILTHDPSWRSD